MTALQVRALSEACREVHLHLNQGGTTSFMPVPCHYLTWDGIFNAKFAQNAFITGG